MLDIGKAELLVVVIMILLVVGPRELPRVMRGLFGMIRKLRGMAGDFQSQLEQMANDADIADIKKTATDARNQALNSADFNPDDFTNKDKRKVMMDKFGVGEDITKAVDDVGKQVQEESKEIDDWMKPKSQTAPAHSLGDEFGKSKKTETEAETETTSPKTDVKS